MTSPLSERLTHPSFPQPPDDGCRVWRYLTTAKFLSLLTSSALPLVRLDLLGDPHEGATPRPLAAGMNKQLRALGQEEGIEALRRIRKQIRASTFVSCWNRSPHENEALWRLYAGANEGVAIATTYAKLSAAIELEANTYLGQVTYIDYEVESFAPDNLYNAVMHKRRPFSHEDEVRIVKPEWNPQDPRADNEKTSVLLHLNLPLFVDYLYVNPYASAWYCDAIVALLARLAPELTQRVRWSELRTDPTF